MKATYQDLVDIIQEASMRLHRGIREAFDEGTLDRYLKSIGMDDLIPEKQEDYDTFPYGDIHIIGDSRIKKKEIIGCCKSLGIEKERLNLKLNYEDIERYPFETLQYNPQIRLVLVGPMPHSIKGKGKYPSMINKIEETDGYPKVIRMISGKELKITKTNLKKVLKEEIDSRYLAV